MSARAAGVLAVIVILVLLIIVVAQGQALSRFAGNPTPTLSWQC